MNTDEIFIKDGILYRRIYETEQVYRDEKIITKEKYLHLTTFAIMVL